MDQDQVEAAIAALAAGIEPPGERHAAALRGRVTGASAGGSPVAEPAVGPVAGIAELAARLAAAQHAPAPAVARRCIVVCAADHGVGADRAVHLSDALGLLPDRESPTRSALRHLAAGGSALSAAAHAARASLVVVDCGMHGDGGSQSPGSPGGPEGDDGGILDLRVGAGTADIRRGAAMSRTEAALSVRTGMALLLSLAENGLDVVCLGHVAVGSRWVSSAVIAALTGMEPEMLGQADRDAVAAALAANAPALEDVQASQRDPLAVLAALGGLEIGALAGVVLAAASLRIPVVLDDHGTSAAALLAARWQPAVAGYLLAAHPGTTPAHRQALRALGLEPILGQALSHGEGTGAAMALPFLDTAADWASRAVGAAVSAGPVHALFVYGSLRSAHPAHALVSPYVAGVAPATTTGRLLVMDGGYPGLVDDPARHVTGELLELRDVDAAFAVLDEYEGAEYRRVLRAVTLADGSERQAWCYVPTPAAAARGGESIAGGDWLAWMRASAAT